MIKWDFSNKIVAITGGTSGLGLALSHAFLESGAKVYGCGVNDAKLKEAFGTLRQKYGSDRVDVSNRDVSNTSQISDWFDMIWEREQRIDILVNAAGVCSVVPTEEVDEALWDQIIDVNLKGTFFACQKAAPLMKSNGYGRIVNISSIGAYNGGTLVSPPYGASKAGVIALSKSFASLYSRHGVCVNSVAPGPFKTDMISDFPEEGLKGMISRTPTGRLGEPQDIVQTVLFLCDESSSHITGATLDINGGLYLR